MHDKKSIYSLNKQDPDAIVYTDADKHTIRLTREDFDTEADFLKWKAWSDENYHEMEKEDHVQRNHTVPLDNVSYKAGTTDSPEITIQRRYEKGERDRYTAETVIRIKGQLTEKQFRRLWLYCVSGMTEQQIAERENVGQQRISRSIITAVKKIKKSFEGRKTGGKKRL